MPTTRVRVVSVCGILMSLCLPGVHVVVTTRTQNAKTLIHLEEVSASGAFSRANLYRTIFRRKGLVGTGYSYLHKIRLLKTLYMSEQFILLVLVIISTGLGFVALRLKLNALLLCIVPITLSLTPISRKHSLGVSLRMA